MIESIRRDVFYTVFAILLAFFISNKVKTVYILKNDAVLMHCDNESFNINNNQVRNDIYLKLKKIFSDIIIEKILLSVCPKNILLLKYSNLLKNKKVTQHVQEDVLNSKSMSVHVNASHYRYFGGKEYDQTNKEHIKYAKLSNINESLNEAIAKALISFSKPDLFITLDGIYSTYGPIVDKMKQENIPILIYQVNGFQDRSIYIGEKHFSVNNISEHWITYKQNNYSIELKKKINIFMEKRLSSLYSINKIEKDKLEKINQNKRMHSKTIVLFPNFPWDGAIKERDIMFDGLLDWLKQTVEWVREKSYYLIIREHPISRKKYNRYESAIELLKEIIPNIDEISNLLLISGIEEISSYKLVREVADCSIVYNGTLGIEISYLGYPIIFAGNSPYSNKGVGYEPKSISEYFTFIENVSKECILFKDKKAEFKKSADIAAAYQFIYNSYYCPIMPKVKDFYNSPNKYWKSWDLDEEHINPERWPEWKRTIDRFLIPIGIK